MVEAYISPATAAMIKDVIKRRAFATSKLLGQTLSLTLWRDDDGDAGGEVIPSQEVLVTLGDEGAARRGDAAQVTTNTGQLRKESPFNVRNGDRFTLPPTHPDLPGVACVVTGPPIDAGAYIAAPFRAEG